MVGERWRVFMGSWKRSAIPRYAAGSTHSTPSFSRSTRRLWELWEILQRVAATRGSRAIRWETRPLLARRREKKERRLGRTILRPVKSNCSFVLFLDNYPDLGRLNPMEICAGSKSSRTMSRPALIPMKSVENLLQGNLPWTPCCGWFTVLPRFLHGFLYFLISFERYPVRKRRGEIGSNC